MLVFAAVESGRRRIFDENRMASNPEGRPYSAGRPKTAGQSSTSFSLFVLPAFHGAVLRVYGSTDDFNRTAFPISQSLDATNPV